MHFTWLEKICKNVMCIARTDTVTVRPSHWSKRAALPVHVWMWPRDFSFCVLKKFASLSHDHVPVLLVKVYRYMLEWKNNPCFFKSVRYVFPVLFFITLGIFAALLVFYHLYTLKFIQILFGTLLWLTWQLWCAAHLRTRPQDLLSVRLPSTARYLAIYLYRWLANFLLPS